MSFTDVRGSVTINSADVHDWVHQEDPAFMHKLPWTAFGLIAAVAMAGGIVAACGSESVTPGDTSDGGDNEGGNADGSMIDPGDTGAIGDAFFDAIVDGGRAETGACTPVAQACAKSTDCCTANCDATSGLCAASKTGCSLPAAVCVTGNECCSGSCVSGACSSTQCVADNAACAVASDCCSDQCVPNGSGGGVCKPLGPKPTSGNPCTMNSQCASSYCNNGICANPSFCTVDTDICSTDIQCCGGLCTKAAGASVGVCGPVPNAGGVVGGPCKPAGELCSPGGTCTGADCCSRSCAPSASSGLGVCQPESGCHLIGDLCMTTTDCCGVKNLPGSIKGGSGPSTDVQCQKAAGATFGICNYVSTVCSPAGALCKPGSATVGGAMSCSTKADCCAGNDNQFPTCQIDTNGIPRCTVTPDLNCANGDPPAGTQCASSADCCGNPCVANLDAVTKATKPFVCGTSQCRQQGTSCTSNGDCCTGLPCALPAGSASGVCGGTLLPDGGVTTTPPPGTDGGVVQPPVDGGSDAAAPVCALYGQTCVATGDCCSGVPCTNGTCHYP